MDGMIRGVFSVLGRAALAAIFLYSALGKIPNFDATADMLGSKGMPAPRLMLAGATAFLVAGGLSVIAGYKTRWGALLLVLFLLPTTYLFHDFWNLTGEAAQGQQAHFMKNLGLAGAMLFLVANGGGAWSFDERRPSPTATPTTDPVIG